MSATTAAIAFVAFVVPVVVGLWAALDANQFSSGDFTAAGTSKALWVALPVLGVFVCLLNFVVAPLWFLLYRRRVAAAAAARRGR